MSDFENSKPGGPMGKPKVFYEMLVSIIKPKNQSDRTSFWKISIWVDRKVRLKKYDNDLFDIVLDFARESIGPDSRNPPAVFTSILKKELNYPN